MTARLDHLVVIAKTLAEGTAWCEATLGVTPGPGGEHPLMGTHNRLLRIATVDFPRAYLEIIAINPAAPTPHPARAGRWFDMDDATLRKHIAKNGPQLAHWVACVPDVSAACAALAAQKIDRGVVLPASRMTPRGLLEWKIAVRDDGQRLFNGVLPTLIEWGQTHPAGGMPDSGVLLQSLTLSHHDAPALQRACDAIGLDTTVEEGPAALTATLVTPRGRVQLTSKGT